MNKYFVRIALTSTALLLATSNAALAVGEIVNPHVTKDELELQYNATRTQDSTGSKTNKHKHSFEVEYGVTDNLLLEAGVKGERKSGDALDIETFKVEAKYEIGDPGEYFIDWALLGEYVFALDGDGADKVEAKLLMQKEYGPIRHRANVILEREVGENSGEGVEIGSRWYSRYKINSHFKPGFEWHAEYGKLDDIADWDDQKHYVGPSAYGDLIKFDDGGKVEYEIAHVFGITDAADDAVTRLKFEYKKKF